MPTLSDPRYGTGQTESLPTVHKLEGAILLSATPAVLRGKGFTVSNPGTGRYVVTWNGKYGRYVSGIGFLRKAAGSATFLTGPEQASSATTCEFRIENASGTAAAPAAATNQIEFIITLCKDKAPI